MATVLLVFVAAIAYVLLVYVVCQVLALNGRSMDYVDRLLGDDEPNRSDPRRRADRVA